MSWRCGQIRTITGTNIASVGIEHFMKPRNVAPRVDRKHFYIVKKLSPASGTPPRLGDDAQRRAWQSRAARHENACGRAMGNSEELRLRHKQTSSRCRDAILMASSMLASAPAHARATARHGYRVIAEIIAARTVSNIVGEAFTALCFTARRRRAQA